MKKKKTIRGVVGGILHRKNPKGLGPIKDDRGAPKGKFGRISDDVQIEMVKDRAAGMKVDAIAEKYAVSTQYLEQALKGVYISTKVGREILKKIFLENALMFSMDSRTKVKDMTGLQSAMAAGIFATKLNDLEKADRDKPADFDAEELKNAIDDLKELKKMIE